MLRNCGQGEEDRVSVAQTPQPDLGGLAVLGHIQGRPRPRVAPSHGGSVGGCAPLSPGPRTASPAAEPRSRQKNGTRCAVKATQARKAQASGDANSRRRTNGPTFWVTSTVKTATEGVVCAPTRSEMRRLRRTAFAYGTSA